MSIKLSIFDFFSFTIPGLLCEALFYYIDIQFFKNAFFGVIKNFGISIYSAAIIIVLAYIMGLVIDQVANVCWWNIFSKKMIEKKLKDILKNYDSFKIKLNPSFHLLYKTYVAQKDKAYLERIDRYDATSILLKSTSFILLIFSLIEIIVTMKYFFSIFHFIAAIIFLCISVIALLGAKKYKSWAIGEVYFYIIAENLNFNRMQRS
jgi:hypothetical protein